jgi:hypothetical protein
MSVKAILNEKGSNVITVTAQVTVQQPRLSKAC